MQLCLKPRWARGIESETFRGRAQLVSRPPTNVSPGSGLIHLPWSLFAQRFTLQQSGRMQLHHLRLVIHRCSTLP